MIPSSGFHHSYLHEFTPRLFTKLVSPNFKFMYCGRVCMCVSSQLLGGVLLELVALCNRDFYRTPRLR